MPRTTKNGNAAPRRRPATARTKISTLAAPSHSVIAARAYELFLRRGGTHGHDWDDWLAAERELRPTPPLSGSSRR